MISSKNFTLEELHNLAVSSLDSSKAQDIVHINLNGNSSIAEEMIICTGTSNRHVVAVADRLIEYLAKHDIHGVHISGENEGKWVIVDLGMIMVHIMQESERYRYQLENLYKCIAAGINEDE